MDLDQILAAMRQNGIREIVIDSTRCSMDCSTPVVGTITEWYGAQSGIDLRSEAAIIADVR